MSVPSLPFGAPPSEAPTWPFSGNWGRVFLWAAPRTDCARLTALPLRGRVIRPVFSASAGRPAELGVQHPSCTGACGFESGMMAEVGEHEGHQRAAGPVHGASMTALILLSLSFVIG